MARTGDGMLFGLTEGKILQFEVLKPWWVSDNPDLNESVFKYIRELTIR